MGKFRQDHGGWSESIWRGLSAFGYDGRRWSIGHVRTRDFRTFEPNPHNPIFTPSTDPDAWDCDGLLTPQVFAMNGTYYMIYAGLKGSGWNRVSAVQTGLAVAGV